MIALIERAEGRICARGCVAELNSTDDVSELIEELQYTLGEGPCADACQQDLVVDRLLADVADDVDARRLRLE